MADFDEEQRLLDAPSNEDEPEEKEVEESVSSEVTRGTVSSGFTKCTCTCHQNQLILVYEDLLNRHFFRCSFILVDP